MSRTRSRYSPRRAGEIIGVEVDTVADRPVTITCNDHTHTYEMAWRDTPEGPVITDLRVTSRDGTPITSATLRRINTDTLARAARRYDTPQAANDARDLRESLEAALANRRNDPAAMVADAIDWFDSLGDESAADAARELRRVAADTDPADMVADGLAGIERFRFTDGFVDAMVRHAPPGVTLAKRRGGRPPKWSLEFLTQVAMWAREAQAYGHAIYPYVADCASEATGEDFGDDAAKWWIKRCKDIGLLGRDELRRPRTTNADQES